MLVVHPYMTGFCTFWKVLFYMGGLLRYLLFECLKLKVSMSLARDIIFIRLDLATMNSVHVMGVLTCRCYDLEA